MEQSSYQSIKALKKGSHMFVDPVTNRKDLITWTFNRQNARGMPVFWIACKMEGFGKTISGSGAGIGYRGAVMRAFCEAWERLWTLHFSSFRQKSPVVSSNGFAAGESEESARIAAKEELIERALFFYAWTNQVGWESLPKKGLINNLLWQYLEAKGWKSRLFGLEDAHWGRVGAILCQHPKEGSYFDAMFWKADHTRAQVQRRLLHSVMKGLVAHVQYKPYERHELPDVGGPEDHWRFYRNPAHSKAYSFLEQSTHEILELPGSHEIELETIVARTWFPAVAYAYNPSWPAFLWGKQSIQGVNPWPHPLA